MRLVLADNDDGALDLIDLDLRLEGHEVLALARNGEDTVDACAAHRPDVLVVDYRMPPGIDGVDVAARVLRAGTSSRVVIYSNYVDPKVIAKAEALGARWLQKGDLSTLRAAVLG